MKKLLLFTIVVAAVGCGGSGGGGNATPAARVATFLTDSMDGNDHVWVTVHSIELQKVAGASTVFDSTAGVQVDLKTLRDGSGARFRFMSEDDVPAGTYTGAKVTLEKNLVVFPSGALTGTDMTFDSSLDTTDGKTAISFSFPTALTVDGGDSDDIVIDFDLANWNESGGIVTPVLKVGSEDGLHDSSRHDDGEYDGIVMGLAGIAPNQTFTLHSDEGHGASDVSVVLDANTQIFAENGAALASNSKVEVDGTFDTTTNTLKASSIRVEDPEDHEQESEDVEGTVSSFDGVAGTIVLNIDHVDGFLPGTTAFTVDASGGATEFFTDSGQSISKEDFFAGLSAGMEVKAIGQVNVDTSTIVATKVSAKNED